MNDPDVHVAVLELTQALMSKPSITPLDEGCQALIAQRLLALGFEVTALDCEDVQNLWATKTFGGDQHATNIIDAHPHLVFAGHTDVVPTGPEEQWHTPPFEPTVVDGFLYGRGAADMKASLAAMVVAAEELCAAAQNSDNPLIGCLSFLITSDEEGPALYGTQYVVQELANKGIQPDHCIVGEPSSSQQLGDVVRCGRRGSINAKLTIVGTQGHVAYPESVVNPIHRGLAALDALVNIEWDKGNQYYPPTSLQISNIHAGTGATNVVPGELEIDFNLRFSTEQTAEKIQQRVADLLSRYDLEYRIDWKLSGNPFLTEHGKFTDVVSHNIKKFTGLNTELSTSGGTSDGRFIAPWQDSVKRGLAPVEVVELGPVNATIHKIDECVELGQLAPLAKIYQGIAQDLFTTNNSH